MKNFIRIMVTIGLVILTIMSLAEVLSSTFNKLIELVKSAVDYLNSNLLYMILIIACVYLIDKINNRFITKKIYRMIY